MPSIDVYNVEGKKVSSVDLKEEIFGIEPNEAVVHSVLVNFLANQRQGTQSTKTRAEVRGGGRKPWRQKGTGRARQGSIRAPQWIKGGIALGPKPRSYKYTVNKKERRLAIKSLLSSKVLENELTVVDAFNFDSIKTKQMVNALTNLKVEGKTLIVLADKNENVQKSARNIENVKTLQVNTINVYDLLKYKNLVLTLDTVKKLEEVYA
ncbi:MAG: 50S ribosomal protein L4 [Clostridia bacterium]|jgi:large subunit ribosomal protein L4|nr:50S ribosomal protein L4 [Clostridia bacterium]MBR2240322.1 50S ribosomal protein L4 [Clostridia bacterium]MBR3720638.1 50S ribosomal protein L4 [Clostridia bacterium]MCR5146471.1 50S ribosomal protein L4 [Clostridia bacterium]